MTEAVTKQSIDFVGYLHMLRLYSAALSAKPELLPSGSNGKMNLLPLNP